MLLWRTSLWRRSRLAFKFRAKDQEITCSLARAEASSTCPAPTPRPWPRPRRLPADALILDLEDSVAPDQKVAARGQVAEAVRKGGFGGREVVIRVNGPHTPWGDEDLAAASAAGPDAILLPKVDGPGAIMAAARALREAGAPERTRIWAMMETPNAVLNAGSIASVAAELGLAPRSHGDGAQRSRQGDASAADPRPPDDDRMARKLRCRGARPRRRHHRRRLQRHQGSRRLPPRMPAGARHGPRRQDAHPPESDRHLQRSVRACSPRRSKAPAPSSTRSRCPRTPAKAQSSSTAGWSNCCTPTWPAARSRSRTRSPR